MMRITGLMATCVAMLFLAIDTVTAENPTAHDMEVYIPDIEAPQQLCMSETELAVLLDLSAAAAGRNATASKQLTTEQLVQLGSIWSRIKCAVCKKGLGVFEKVVVKHGCALADGAAASACQLAGLGPEDPLSDICTAAFITGCKIIFKDVVKKHIANPTTICSHIHMC